MRYVHRLVLNFFTTYIFLKLVKSVQQHPHDTESLEVVIALLTVKIRNRQKYLVELYPYKNQPFKHGLTHMVSSRRKLLTHLRETDYR